METIEIKQHRKLNIIFISILSAVFIAHTLYFFFSTQYKEGLLNLLLYFIADIFILYTIYNQVIKLIRRTAIIALSNDFVILHEGLKSTSLPKKDILSMHVEYISEDGNFLITKTENTTHKTNINWLEKTPDEIKSIVKDYLNYTSDKL